MASVTSDENRLLQQIWSNRDGRGRSSSKQQWIVHHGFFMVLTQDLRGLRETLECHEYMYAHHSWFFMAFLWYFLFNFHGVTKIQWKCNEKCHEMRWKIHGIIMALRSYILYDDLRRQISKIMKLLLFLKGKGKENRCSLYPGNRL